MNECYAVLLDTVSIQNYIFRSNKLKENLGASYLVDQIFGSYLAEAIGKITGRSAEEERQHLFDWENTDAETLKCADAVEIGYIGGGNALLFFQKESQAKQFIEIWTKILLVYAPGLTTAVALNKFPQDPTKFKSSLNSLFKKLKENKSRYIPITTLPRHGITAECARSELSAEIYNSDIKEYVSADVNARIEAARFSKEKIEQKYQALLQDKYCFVNELDKLGGVQGEDSHIAVVHIDGNDVGKLVKQADSLKASRYLSKTIRTATERAFEKIIEITVNKYDEIMDSLGFSDENPPKKENDKNVLPIRSIILGGDDVTFVCDARLGIYFAKIFIKEFEGKTKENGKKLTACAGVSIIKTKYPFYRGYWLAEELCANAKARRKEVDETTSFLDFHVSMGGVAGSLKYIRERYFGIDPRGNDEKGGEYLLYRPLKVVPKEPFDELGLEMMLAGVWHLKNDFPKNKLADLRAVLTHSRDARLEFVQDLKYRGLEFPKIEGYQFENELFENNLTPYFDMLELLRFYPEFALKEIGENHE